jgi:hypothetical protein
MNGMGQNQESLTKAGKSEEPSVMPLHPKGEVDASVQLNQSC